MLYPASFASLGLYFLISKMRFKQINSHRVLSTVLSMPSINEICLVPSSISWAGREPRSLFLFEPCTAPPASGPQVSGNGLQDLKALPPLRPQSWPRSPCGLAVPSPAPAPPLGTLLGLTSITISHRSPQGAAERSCHPWRKLPPPDPTLD